MTTSRSIRRGAAAGLLAVALAAEGCGDDDASSTGDADSQTATTMASSAAGSPSGPGCASVPEDGSGSFAGMAEDPAATAASNNPVLSTLVSAMTEAGLVDTLNSEGPFTIFAPTNDAFAKIPEADLSAVLADKDMLTKILTLHVVPGKMSAAELLAAGSVASVEGEQLAITGEAPELTVGGSATVVCGDVQVANATVHIIDTVLMPMG